MMKSKKQNCDIVEEGPQVEVSEDEVMTGRSAESKWFYEHEDDWDDTIRERGMNYYYDDRVRHVYKSKNKYLAKVEGSGCNEYNVVVDVLGDELEMSCDCPCDYPCKHEYAVMMAIIYGEYQTIELKDFVRENVLNLKTLIEKIPAKELKEYLLDIANAERIILGTDVLYEKFEEYRPLQPYDFYFNNLYNELKVGGAYTELITSYCYKIQNYLADGNFAEAFKIIKAIIENLDRPSRFADDYFMELVAKLGMFLRITYRKADDKLRAEMSKWAGTIAQKNYFDNIFLEDALMHILG